MTITVELPDNIEKRPNPGREALEALAIAGYRAGSLTPQKSRILLGFAVRDQLEGFLKAHNVIEGAYSVEDFEQNIATSDRLDAAGLLRRGN
jgi:hypothetical protein